ncbi:ABC transporter substrate-binding protein [Pseudaminobacter sp. NGMCC 1.201702]|uniref:ABC transporter substrate-binding protein n=1 Tax=Pseudaminobacter sp. NGMCC 1.201702 TaxID=3391825 RepID=UPI0039F0FABE
MRKRNSILRSALISGALMFGATVPSHAEDINIGVNMPLTGAFAASGDYVTNGAKIAVEEINAKGGVLGKKLNLVIEDNKSNPTEAAAVTEKLIVRDKVPVLLGAWGSSLTLATMPKLMQYQVPMVVETSGANKITESGNPYVFRIAATQNIEAKGFEEKLGLFNIKKVDFLVINNDWGRSTVTEFTKMLESKSIQVGYVEMMDQATQDVSSQLSKLKSSDSDTIIVTTAVEQLTLVLKQAQALGIDKQIITTGGSQNPDQLIEQAGSAAENTTHLVFFAPWEPENTAYPEKTRAFIETWKAKGYNFAGLTESFRGYDGIQVIAAAIEKAGATDPVSIQKALWETKVDVLNGAVSFAKVGQSGAESAQSTPNIYFGKVENGKVHVLQ